MTFKRIILIGAVALAGLVYIASSKGYLTLISIETNPMCKVLTDQDYQNLETELLSQKMSSPQGDILRLGFEFDFGMPVHETDVMVFSLGTTSALDEVEYIGPPRAEFEIVVPFGFDQKGLPVSPVVSLLRRSQRAICHWTADAGFTLEGPSSWHIALHNTRTPPGDEEAMRSDLTLTAK